MKKKSELQKLKDKLWEECKRITRARYENHNGWECYTCGGFLDEPRKAQTGHFIPSSICSVELRYDLDNLRVQCYRCNINLSGNWPAYERKLEIEMGKGFTAKLKQRNEDTKGLQYGILWYQDKLKEYKQL